MGRRPRVRKRWISITVFLGALLLCFALFELGIRSVYGTHLFYEVDEELYWKLAPSQQGYQVLGFPHATINSDGFRGPELQDGKTNILVLGDSNVFGENVADEETFPFLLGQKLKARNSSYQVINAGTPGWGLFQMERLLLDRFDDYSPRAVILMLSWFDLPRQPFADEEEKQAYLRRQHIRDYLRPFASLSYLNHQFQKVSGSYFFSSTENYGDFGRWDQYWEQDRDRLVRIHEFLDEQDAELYLVYYPHRKEGGRFGDLVRNFTEGTDIRLIVDLEESFHGIPPDELRIAGDGHPSPFAYRLVAERVFAEMEEHMPGLAARDAASG